MKILFLIPPITYHPSKGVLAEPLQTGASYPNLGIRHIAAFVESCTTHETELIDAPSYGMSYKTLEHVLASIQVDIVAITVLTHTLFDAIKSVRLLKQIHPRCIIILGGYHLSLYYKETSRIPGVDFVLSGEADLSFMHLIEALSRSAFYSQLGKIPGLAWHHSSNVNINPLPPKKPDLSQLPLPIGLRMEQTAFAGFYPTLAKKAFIQTSRGCPFKCSFCSINGSHLRYRSVEIVLREIEFWLKQGISEIFFVDDTFTVSRGRVSALCQEIIRRNLKIQFRANSRVDLVDKMLLSTLREAGCKRLYYGVESGVQRTLDILHKEITLKKIENVFRMTQIAGIETCAYLMIGLPDETIDEIYKTISFAESLQADQIRLNIFDIYPGTEIYNSLLSDGVIDHDYWQSFSECPSDKFQLNDHRIGIDYDELCSIISQSMQTENQTHYTRYNTEPIRINIFDDCKKILWQTADGNTVSSDCIPITLHPDNLFSSYNQLPILYIWRGLSILYDDPHVFRPTLDSLLLAYKVWEHITSNHLNVHTLADLGAGSGIIGLALAKMLEIPRLLLIDNNTNARNLCRRNSQQISNTTEVVVLKSISQKEIDIWGADFAVANPPYYQDTNPPCSSKLRRVGSNGNGVMPNWIAKCLDACIPFAFVLDQRVVDHDWLLNESQGGQLTSMGHAIVIDRYSQEVNMLSNSKGQSHVIEFLLCDRYQYQN